MATVHFTARAVPLPPSIYLDKYPDKRQFIDMNAAALIDLSNIEKLFVISDIHGKADQLRMAFGKFSREKEFQILIAGDLLIRHSSEAASIIKRQRNRITAVRGNCDSSIDQDLAGTPLPLVQNISWNNRSLLLTHGHTLSQGRVPILPSGSILITGHTHYPALSIDKESGIILLNPGSISSPRKGSQASYAVITKTGISVLSLFSGKKLLSLSFT
ncbi:MAG: YfcE family phosphodiesterase [Spirochaetes bacterium]|nr:YfcE family phosphodiesterase [Spirochaetota bacterium]